jgi:hypothetical protein
VLSALTAFSLRPPFHFPFILHLWSRTLEQRLPTLSHYHVASVYSPIHPHSSFPLYAYMPYPIPITGTSEIASMIQILDSTHVFKSALLLVEEGIDSDQFYSSSPLFSLSHSVLSIIGDCSVELLSARSRPIPLLRLSFPDLHFAQGR